MGSSLALSIRQDYDATAVDISMHEGCRVLQKLRDGLEELKWVKPITLSIHAKRTSPEFPGVVLSAACHADSALVQKLPPGIDAVCLSRQLTWCIDNVKYQMFGGLLCSSEADARRFLAITIDVELDEEYKVALWVLPEGERDKFQEQQFVKGVADLLRVQGNIEQVKLFFAALRNFTVPPSISSEVTKFKTLLSPMDEAVTSSTLKSTLDEFLSNGELKLHKPLSLFPTGDAIKQDVNLAIKQRSTDAAVLKSIAMAKTLTIGLKALTQTGANGVMAGETIGLPKAELGKWEELWTLYCRIVTSSSADFQDRHKVDIFAIKKRLDDAREFLVKCARKRMIEQAKKVKICAIEYLDTKGKAPSQITPKEAMFKRETDAYFKACLFDASRIGIMKISRPDDEIVVKFASTVETETNFISTLVSSLSPLVSGSFDLDSDTNVAFCSQMLTSAPDPDCPLAIFAEFKLAAMDAYGQEVSKMVVSALSSIKAFVHKVYGTKGKTFLDLSDLGLKPVAKIDDAASLCKTILTKHSAMAAAKKSVAFPDMDPLPSCMMLCMCPTLYSFSQSVHLLSKWDKATTFMEGDEIVLKLVPDCIQKKRDAERMLTCIAGQDVALVSDFLALLDRIVDGKTREWVEIGVKAMHEFTIFFESMLGDESAIGKLMKSVDGGDFTPTKQQQLLTMVVDNTAFYEKNKAAKKLMRNIDSNEYADLVSACPQSLGGEHTAAKAKLNALLPDSNKASNAMTTVQALFRPTRVGETRESLALRCRAVVKQDIPQNLDLALSQFSAPAGDAGAGTLDSRYGKPFVNCEIVFYEIMHKVKYDFK